MEAHHLTLVHSSTSLISLVDERCVLLVQTVVLYRQSNCLQSAVYSVLTYKVIHGGASSYLGPLVHVADLPGRRALRSAGSNCQSNCLYSQQSRLPGRCYPTVERLCLTTSLWLIRCRPFGVNSNIVCSSSSVLMLLCVTYSKNALFQWRQLIPIDGLLSKIIWFANDLWLRVDNKPVFTTC